MDDLCIKMIANTRKLKEEVAKTLNQDQKPLSTQQVDRLIQIFENEILCYSKVVDNFDDFLSFMKCNSAKIIASFEKSLNGKTD